MKSVNSYGITTQRQTTTLTRKPIQMTTLDIRYDSTPRILRPTLKKTVQRLRQQYLDFVYRYNNYRITQVIHYILMSFGISFATPFIDKIYPRFKSIIIYWDV
ncbi:unnamed protein product [Toxocara canis]|uniref:Transmembrane protein n=1 Tax=Toxocara canis TaxID=6265 RepID=A0A183U839_TOXCA|nr:unnamed protein product [Toxocara canis]